MPIFPPTLGSTLTVSGISAVGKAYLKFGCKSVTVSNKEILHDALRLKEKGKGRERGVLTITNHVSVLDDPLTWVALMPWSAFWNPNTTRWVPGARDIMFTNPVFSKFFSLGQVVECDRFGGIFQDAILECSNKLSNGNWVNVFPEGKCYQPGLTKDYVLGGTFMFRWGVSRILFGAKTPPTIIPIHIAGFDQMMPEPRPHNFLPVNGAEIKILVGEPLDNEIWPLWEEWCAARREGVVSDYGYGPEERKRRSTVAKVMEEAIQKLGRTNLGLDKKDMDTTIEDVKKDLSP